MLSHLFKKHLRRAMHDSAQQFEVAQQQRRVVERDVRLGRRVLNWFSGAVEARTQRTTLAPKNSKTM